MKSSSILIFAFFCCLRAKNDARDLYIPEINVIKNADDKFKKLIKSIKENKGQESYSCLHVGDSHVQIGSFPAGVMEALNKDTIETRTNWILPMNLFANLYPQIFQVQFKGNWNTSSLKIASDQIPVGITGRTASLTNKKGEIILRSKAKEKLHSLTIIHEKTDELNLSGRHSAIRQTLCGTNSMRSEVDCLIGRKKMRIRLENQNGKPLNVYGIAVNEKAKGLKYSNFGVSGATYLELEKAALLTEQLAILQPNLVMVTLGTNDAYQAVTRTVDFKEKLRILYTKMKEASPESQFILMTSPETAYNGETPANLDYVNKAIQTVADEMKLPFWDWYHIVGGEGSLKTWVNAGLFDADHLHLNTKGYTFLGQLFAEALLKTAKS